MTIMIVLELKLNGIMKLQKNGSILKCGYLKSLEINKLMKLLIQS